MNNLDLDIEMRRKLIETAKDFASQSYSPYSHFPVGAAILSSDGQIFGGCNIENASYPLGNCAERTAIFKAVSNGVTDVLCVVVYTPTESPSTPCGACRQVINEFGPTAQIICVCDSDKFIETSLDQMLLYAFGPKNLH